MREAGASWSSRRERGSTALAHLMAWIALNLGWSTGHALLYPITCYFFLFSRGARPASRHYLVRALGRPARTREVFQHFFTFAAVLLERLFLVSGRTESFHVEIEGIETLETLLGKGRGCILLGAHFGSFEVLRELARRSPVPVQALFHHGRRGVLDRLLAKFAQNEGTRSIAIGAPEAMLEIRESLAGGGVVGILADRSPEARKCLQVPFFGTMAAFPTGPFILAAHAGAPVVLFFGVRKGDRAYRITFEPFADQIVLPPTQRSDDLRLWIGRYAAQLEAHCCSDPFNWFNFYEFW